MFDPTAKRIAKALEDIVSGLTDLNANLAAQTAALSQLSTDVTTLASQAGDSDPAVEAAAAQVATNNDTIASIQSEVSTALGSNPSGAPVQAPEPVAAGSAPAAAPPEAGDQPVPPGQPG